MACCNLSSEKDYMATYRPTCPHSFHIPVMGTGFTIDSPLKIGRYGITSVVSIVDDQIIELMREHYCKQAGEPYEQISMDVEDYRAKRITAYLDLMDRILSAQFESLKAAEFAPGSELTRYFDLLPEGELKSKYKSMLATDDAAHRARMQSELRDSISPGRIDVNIMTKVDCDNYRAGQKLPAEFSDALSALRGYAKSAVRSSIVFSAGLNPRLYNYINKFDVFLPGADGEPMKKIILKVSDYRSALIQGKYLAKHGLWVSEYRVESGLNCGGHAFPTTGYLMGPIMKEFRDNRSSLVESVMPIYAKGLKSLGIEPPASAPPVRITVQGGIGTSDENDLLLKYYEVDGTGWGTPFMLVPEATTVDEEHLRKLADAGQQDVYLSQSSPFGVPFWILRNAASELSRMARIKEGSPGAKCVNGYLRMNTEFTPERPICAASKEYIKRKIEAIPASGLKPAQQKVVTDDTLAKACICFDLAGVAKLAYGIDPDAKPCICCGPNIVNFNRTYTLEEMVGHIYGRIDLLKGVDRPHMFIRELALYVDYLKAELESYALELSTRTPKYFAEFKEALLHGIDHYKAVAERVIEEKKARFLSDLDRIKSEIESIAAPVESEKAV